MTQRSILSITLSCLLLAALNGCNKARDNGGTFTVKGQWLKDCSGAAHSGELLTIDLKRYGFNSKETFDNAGSGLTDADGRFSNTCENHGVAELSITGTQGGFGGLDVMGGDGNIDDLGILYDEYTASATLKFSFARPHADTFFVTDGIARDTFKLFPASGTKYISLTKWGRGERTNRVFQGHYGFGRADFSRPVNSGDSRILLLTDAFQICAPADTTLIAIP